MTRYRFNNQGYTHYVDSEEALSQEELKQIGNIMAHFPHASKSRDSIKSFLAFSPNDFPEKLIRIAVNAFDYYGNTVLGVACEYGYSVEAVQKLINYGAALDTPDHNMSKLALHWAINNKLSFENKDSEDAVAVVQCLLNNGARTDITCYRGETPLQYASSRNFTAAARLITKHVQDGPAQQISQSSNLLQTGMFSTSDSQTKKNDEKITSLSL